MQSDDEQPIGDVLDALGITASIEPDDLVAGAVVLLKVIKADGATRLSLAHSQGLGRIERIGMLRITEQLEVRATERRDGA